MAARKPAKRPRIVTVSKEEKAARAGLVKSAQLGLAQTSARVATQSRGAYGVRTLRQSGTNLAAYDIGGYRDTTAIGPAVPPGSGTQPPSGGGRKRTPSKPPKKQPDLHNKKQMKKEGKKQQHRISDARAEANAREAKRRLAAKKKRDAARAADRVPQAGRGRHRSRHMKVKALRRQMSPGSTYRKPGAPVKGLPKMNLPTVGRGSKMMPSAAKVKPIKPIGPLKPPTR